MSWNFYITKGSNAVVHSRGRSTICHFLLDFTDVVPWMSRRLCNINILEAEHLFFTSHIDIV